MNYEVVADTRERLIESATQLFWENGYSQTSLADVMDHGRVNSGSLYYFFKTKENLLLAVLERYKEMLQPVLLAPIWEKESDPIKRIFALLARYRDAVLSTSCTYGCPIGRLALEIDPEQREVHRLIAENFEGWSRAIQQCLEEARERLPKTLDLKTLSRFVLAVMEGGVMQSRSYRSVEPFDQAVRQLGDYFRRLLAEGGARQASYWDTL